MNLSIVIPSWNEAESLPELLERVQEHAKAFAPYEILVIDDGSSDGSPELLERMSSEIPELGYYCFGRNYGKSAALALAFQHVRGEIVITMDADLQDDPAEITALISRLNEGWDLVSGWKEDRKDPLSKTLPSFFFNRVMRRVTGLKLHDFNCGLKAYRQEVVKNLRVYGELHRFLPALANWDGFQVTEIPVHHHARKYGESKFGMRRYLNGFFDLMTISFTSRSSLAPLHTFGRVGFFFFLTGFAINAWFGGVWLETHALRVRPLLILGWVLLILAIQFWSLGLLGELMIHLRAREESYRIKSWKEPHGS